MHAKLFQSCLTLCDPMDCSLPGSSVCGFSRQEYWSRLPCPLSGDLPNPEIKPESPMSPVLAQRFFTTRATGKPLATFILEKVLDSTPTGLPQWLSSKERICLWCRRCRSEFLAYLCVILWINCLLCSWISQSNMYDYMCPAHSWSLANVCWVDSLMFNKTLTKIYSSLKLNILMVKFFSCSMILK